MRILAWACCSATLTFAVCGEVAAKDLTSTSVPTIAIAPSFEPTLRRVYGESEGPVLVAITTAAVQEALRAHRCGSSVRMEVQVQNALPTHPTDKQIGDNAAISRLQTRYLGGASFAVRLDRADGTELKSLHYEWYAQNYRLGSKAADSWGDVRLASQGLGEELAKTCSELDRVGARTP